MDFFENFLSFGSAAKSKEFDKINTKLAIPDVENKDPWSYENLAVKNLDRSQFTYSKLVDFGWWPDRVLQFIQVNRLAYVDVMHIHEKYISTFDEPLRLFISWLQTMKIKNKKLQEMKVSFLKEEDIKIPNRYWSYVLIEDNCYMYEFEQESAIRSKNESKHYKLFQLVRYVVIEGLYDDPLLTVYLALYNLRGGHARVDDYFRKMLYHFLNEEDFVADFDVIVFELPNEVDQYLEICSGSKDSDIINKLALFRDILRYVGYQILIFKQVFINENIDVYEDLLDIQKEQIKEATYTYKYFWEKIENKEIQDELLLQDSSLKTIINIQLVQRRKRLQTPSYTIQNINGHSSVLLDPKVQAETRKRSRSVGYAPMYPKILHRRSEKTKT